MRVSLHNHSVFSDGQDTPQRIYDAAVSQQVDCLGFADHYYRISDDPAEKTPEWALQLDKLDRYFKYVGELRHNPNPIEIMIGMEFDWLGNADHLAPMVRDHRLDFTIGSVHYINHEACDSSKKYWLDKSDEAKDEAIIDYWHAVRNMAASGLFQIVGHMDLVKKFEIYPTRDVTAHIQEALEAIKSSGMIVELNTSGWVKDCKEAYPSEAILRACFTREIPVMIGSDSHRARFVASNFTRAADLLHRVGYTQLSTIRDGAVYHYDF